MLKDEGVGCCCPLGLCHVSCHATVAFSFGCVRPSVPLLHSSAPSLSFSHPQAHGTTRRVRLSGKAEPCWKRLCTLWIWVIYPVLTFLFTVQVRSAENPDQKSYFTAVLWHVCIAPNCIYCRLNQIWTQTLHYKEGLPH